jgi:uncharacterized protein
MTRALRRIALFVCLGVGLALAVLPSQAFSVATTVFINELHYDNVGTDVGEFIEIIGPTGTDLSGWQVVLYNGMGGVVYNTTTIPASTILGNLGGSCAGYGVYVVNITGIQNGAPDGMALVNAGGTLLQFLSYEGAFTGVGGAANGVTSTDIGTAETGTELAGLSLQATGTGSQYSSFTTWTTPVTATSGACNTGQTMIAGDTAPTVSTIVPANAATGVAINSDVTITFSEPVTVTGNWFSVVCATSGTRDTSNTAVTGGPTTFTINPNVDFANNEVCNVTVVAAQVADQDANDPPDTMAANFTSQFTTIAAVTITRIHTIQGSGATVTGPGPFTVQAIVTGDYQTPSTSPVPAPATGSYLRGFFIQEEDADVDALTTTSEGIFVFCAACPVAVAVGDLVTVTGNAIDFFGMSQLNATTLASITVNSSGNPLPSFSTIDLPIVAPVVNDFYEQYEGMLVRFTDVLSVSEYFELARFGQLLLYEGGRPYQYTHTTNTPTAAGNTAYLDGLARRRVILDDTNNVQNEVLIQPATTQRTYHPQTGGLSIGTQGVNFFRGGDTVSNLTGILHWSFAGQGGTDAWRIRPVQPQFPITFTAVNTRPANPTIAGNVTVASFNLLNYFTTIDTGASICGPAASLGCRGADSAAEFVRQQQKTAASVCGLNADVLGVMELENNALVTITDLRDTINASCGGANPYAFIDTGTLGTDAIRVALLYRTGVVAPVGPFLADADPVHNRPPLAQMFEVVEAGNPDLGARFTVVVNHFKSKSPSGCAGLDCDQLDGQSAFNPTRTNQANRLATWISGTVLPAVVDPDVLIIGDLNAYKGEDPIDALRTAGYTDMAEALNGPNAYSYVFNGQLGYLDHALANAALQPQVVGVVDWHINADEVPLFDYNDATDDGGGEAAFEEEPDGNTLFENNAYRTSDHDPVLIGLDLGVPSPTPVPAVVGGGSSGTGTGALLRLVGVSVSQPIARPGAQIVWTYTVENISGGTLNDVRARVRFADDDMIGVSATSSIRVEGGFSRGSLLVDYNLGTITANQLITLTITTRLPNRAAIYTGTLTASVGGAQQTQFATLSVTAAGTLPATGETPIWSVPLRSTLLLVIAAVLVYFGAGWALRTRPVRR